MNTFISLLRYNFSFLPPIQDKCKTENKGGPTAQTQNVKCKQCWGLCNIQLYERNNQIFGYDVSNWFYLFSFFLLFVKGHDIVWAKTGFNNLALS